MEIEATKIIIAKMFASITMVLIIMNTSNISIKNRISFMFILISDYYYHLLQYFY